MKAMEIKTDCIVTMVVIFRIGLGMVVDNMTNEQLKSEIFYQASISPFRTMVENAVITREDYAVIDTILREKYSPIFVGFISQNPLDNTGV